jgi:hypothetical protein
MLARSAVGDDALILKRRTTILPEVNFSDEGKLRNLHLGTACSSTRRWSCFMNTRSA